MLERSSTIIKCDATIAMKKAISIISIVKSEIKSAY